ncbi:MAG TPA: hypothetical protein PKD16_10000 [Saprospiraceae bacterium]|nr:hypothetical protein [Saprospiraceae bacterium]
MEQDKIFKKIAENHELDIDFDTLWENLEPHVPTKKKRRPVFWFWLAGVGMGIMAVLVWNYAYNSDTNSLVQNHKPTTNVVISEADSENGITALTSTSPSQANTATHISPTNNINQIRYQGEEHRKNTIELDSKNGNLKSSQVFESIFNTAFEEIEPKISLAFPTLSNETIKSETFKNEISQTEERNLENLLPLPKNEVKILFENSVPAPIIYPRRHVAFNIIFFAGGGLSKLSYTTKSTDYQHLTKMNNSEKGMEFLNIGIATDIRITSKWSVNTGIRYSRWVTQINNISSQSTPFEKEGIVEIVIDEQGSETNFTGKTQGITEKSVVQKWHTFHHQLEVPVQLRYQLFKVNNHHISLAGGTTIPFFSKTNGGYLSQEDKLVKFENESSPFISQKTSWNGGLVWEWALRPEWSLQTGVLYEQKTFVLKDINTEINKNMAAFYLSLGCKRKF